MSNDTLFQLLIPLGGLLFLGLVFFFWGSGRRTRIQKRLVRVTAKKQTTQQQKSSDTLFLRRKSHGGMMLAVSKILNHLPTQAVVRARLERAGATISPELYMVFCLLACVGIAGSIIFINGNIVMGVTLGLFIGLFLPHVVIGIKGNRRVKKFLQLFPDAIDFIVRGLRSGLPVTESMNMVGLEMEQPIGGIFASMGEAVRLGVPVEKSMQDMAVKLQSTEFNFFVTTIILQRETGGNLSEVLNNLADVLRKRFMMQMKIKAMSSEAKASILILGSLPFLVISALLFTTPNYLDPFIYDVRGHVAAGIAVTSLLLGVGIMFKMSRFEI